MPEETSKPVAKEEAKIPQPVEDYKIKPIAPAPPEFEVGPIGAGGTIENAFIESRDAATTPLSQLFHPDDLRCPVCHEMMPVELSGLSVRNPDGFVVCRKCVRKHIGDE